jgi:hypothetical protein
MTVQDVFSDLDVLLDQLVVGTTSGPDSARVDQYTNFAYLRAGTVLRADEDERVRRRFETRLRLALHLAPASAIGYERSNPLPRWRLISDHLVSYFDRDRSQCESLAREIATLLDNWDRERRAVAGHRAFLAQRDGPRCRNCRVEFGTAPRSLLVGDIYKPYVEAPDELLSVEVDHREAVSGLGTNAVENLQLLCRLCNGGKGDGLGLGVRQEARFAGVAVTEIPRAHRCRMLYYVLERDRCRCFQCGDDRDNELTIRPLIETGAFVRSNMRTVCFGCL